ncbi:MAG: NAD-dependent epimerase/dehydratase family protein [Armatimonadota bacterium]
MNVLVTGGAGFIGSNLVQALIVEGHTVTVLDNFLSGYPENLAPFPQVRMIERDIRNSLCVEEAMAGVEVVFHLAASVGNKRSIDNPLLDAEINVLGTLNVLTAAQRSGVRKVVMSSSAGIYGELKTIPIREDHPAEPDSPYGASKLCAEKEGLSFAKLFSIEVAALRYFNVYGPNQRYDAYGNVIPIFMAQLLRSEPLTIFGDGEQTRDFVNIHDVVQANIRAAQAKGVSGAFNIGSGTRITINALVELMQEISGKQTTVNYAAPRPGDVRHSQADIQAAHCTFGFSPGVSIRNGLCEYIAWAQQEFLAQEVSR